MKKRKVTLLDKTVRVAAVLLAVFLLLGCIAGTVDPRTNKLLPFFGLAYPFLLLLNILMIIWWCFRRRWIFTVLTLAVIGLGWRALKATVNIAGEKGEGPKTSADLVRMMTYNVHSFKPFDSGNVESVKEKMLQVVKKENPDIMCFQEYYTRRKGSYAITDSLKRLLNTPYYYFLPSSKNNYEAMGLAIFSKYPIKDQGHLVFDANHTGNASIYVDVEIGTKMLRVYNVHLQSIAFDKQDYQYLDKVTQKMDAEIVPSKRILNMLNSAFLKRSAQVDIMKASMKTCKIPFLIAGDFNDTPASYAVTQLTASLNKTFEKKGSGLGRTYNGKFPNFQIDYIAVTKDIEVMNHKIVEARLSDHFPVRSDLRLKP